MIVKIVPNLRAAHPANSLTPNCISPMECSVA